MPSLTVAGPVPRPVTGVHLSRRNNLRRRSLTYHEIALLELLRKWESLTDGDWDELVSAVRKAVRKSQVRIAAIRSALAGERSPVVRVTFEWLARDITSNGAAPEPAQ